MRNERNACEGRCAWNRKALSDGAVRLRAGIGYSNDKLMQWRLMSYDDTQRYRIGPNFALLPVNRPRCPLRNHRQDGCAQHDLPMPGLISGHKPWIACRTDPVPANSASFAAKSLCRHMSLVLLEVTCQWQAGLQHGTEAHDSAIEAA